MEHVAISMKCKSRGKYPVLPRGLYAKQQRACHRKGGPLSNLWSWGPISELPPLSLKKGLPLYQRLTDKNLTSILNSKGIQNSWTIPYWLCTILGLVAHFLFFPSKLQFMSFVSPRTLSKYGVNNISNQHFQHPRRQHILHEDPALNTCQSKINR